MKRLADTRAVMIRVQIKHAEAFPEGKHQHVQAKTHVMVRVALAHVVSCCKSVSCCKARLCLKVSTIHGLVRVAMAHFVPGSRLSMLAMQL